MDFSDIETGVIEELKSKGLKEFNIKDFDVRNEKSTLQTPAVYCYIEDARASRIGEDVHLEANMYITVVFGGIRSEADRRKGIYPILFGIILSLTGNNLGLGIYELEPQGVRNITDRKDAENGLTVFRLKFEAGLDIEIDEDADAPDLITVGLDYLLKPGDATVHASDEIDLTI